MQKPSNAQRPESRRPKGFQDTGPREVRALARMLATIREVYETYGFEPLETSAIEHSDALGKFLPDQDRPNAGVFSFQDDDEQWLSLRYDLTAPLARYVAENFDRLPKPYRRYATGAVWRNEKPGPGRFRQFTQFDADTVGAETVAADAEMCMLAADTLERLGIARGDYVVKVNNRKVLDGVMEAVGVGGEDHAATRLVVLRAIDKLDRLGIAGVKALLGAGRKDDSGDFTKGAGLGEAEIARIVDYLEIDAGGAGAATVARLGALVGHTELGRQGVEELAEIAALSAAAGYGSDRIRIDPAVVRGLEYYTGPVYEAELTIQVAAEDGTPVRFGSVGGGGRYDDLVSRFTGQKVPATGFSIGVSRLLSALTLIDAGKSSMHLGPVVVLVMDRQDLARYQRLAQALRAAGIAAEMYLGSSGMKAQMKYADRRGAPCVVIQGGDEVARGEVQIKDLIEGSKASETIKDAKAWREGRPAQISVPEHEMVEAVRLILSRHAT